MAQTGGLIIMQLFGFTLDIAGLCLRFSIGLGENETGPSLARMPATLPPLREQLPRF